VKDIPSSRFFDTQLWRTTMSLKERYVADLYRRKNMLLFYWRTIATFEQATTIRLLLLPEWAYRTNNHKQPWTKATMILLWTSMTINSFHKDIRESTLLRHRYGCLVCSIGGGRSPPSSLSPWPEQTLASHNRGLMVFNYRWLEHLYCDKKIGGWNLTSQLQ
jgi:hypothetical protein